MAKYEKHVHGNFKNIVNQLEKDIINNGLSMNLVDESNYESADISMAVRVYDKYFMRNGSRASLSVTVIDSGNEIFISAIGAGGGRGVVFNFSLGAESELTEVVADSIRKMGL
ncbi:MAG: DUF6054 family protein [Clostridia bacterium]|jgi:hypothetical protein|nr:DUF6054 family protein [Clostridia bacterium]MCI1999772.1 DUF6054 family protein [Clostridia bacterium]MCI2014312.1 DUF6054 family protein [Clostridia bacterium]